MSYVSSGFLLLLQNSNVINDNFALWCITSKSFQMFQNQDQDDLTKYCCRCEADQYMYASLSVFQESINDAIDTMGFFSGIIYILDIILVNLHIFICLSYEEHLKVNSPVISEQLQDLLIKSCKLYAQLQSHSGTHVKTS